MGRGEILEMELGARHAATATGFAHVAQRLGQLQHAQALPRQLLIAVHALPSFDLSTVIDLLSREA
jgi:hypothetical protein